MKVIIYTRDNGNLSIVVPSPNYSGTLEDLAELRIPTGVSFTIVDRSKIPDDRTFRNAWEKGTTATPVRVNMNKARNIHMDKIRTARDEKILLLDCEEFTAKRGTHPQGKTEQNIWDEKQVLLDIPQTFDLTIAKNAEELKALWPQDLI